MFDLSWAEMAVIVVVGLLVLGPDELPGVVRACRKVVLKVRQMGKQVTSVLDEIESVSDLKKEVQKVNDDIQKIVDLDGNMQEIHDISEVMPEIEAAKKSRKM